VHFVIDLAVPDVECRHQLSLGVVLQFSDQRIEE